MQKQCSVHSYIVDGALNGNGQDYDSDSSYIVVYEDKDTHLFHHKLWVLCNVNADAALTVLISGNG